MYGQLVPLAKITSRGGKCSLFQGNSGGGGCLESMAKGEKQQSVELGLNLKVPICGTARRPAQGCRLPWRPIPELPGLQRTELKAGSMTSANAWTAKEI